MDEIGAYSDLLRTLARTLRRRVIGYGFDTAPELAAICTELEAIARKLDRLAKYRSSDDV